MSGKAIRETLGRTWPMPQTSQVARRTGHARLNAHLAIIGGNPC